MCFNALLRAFSFSTVYDKLLSVLKQRVSMPYFGLFPFLHIEALTESIDRLGFNALLRAFSFSTARRIIKKEVNLWRFQCPTSGFFLFYKHVLNAKSRRKKHCFNALLRAFSFSTIVKSCWHQQNNYVSMPYFGLFPFLRYVSTAIDFTGFPASIL